MPRERHNWEAYRQAYFEAPEDNYAKFFSTHFPSVSPNVYKRKTLGWFEEKHQIKKEATERVKEKIIQAEGWTAEKLLKLKWSIVAIVAQKLNKERDTLSAFQLKALWEMVKTEIGEASQIVGQAGDTNLDLLDREERLLRIKELQKKLGLDKK